MHHNSNESRPDAYRTTYLKGWTFLVVMFSLLFVFFTYKDFGITWDESVQSTYGELVRDYFASGFQDKRCNTFLNLRHYGPLFELLCAHSYATVPGLKYEIRHLLTGFAAVLKHPATIIFCISFKYPLVPYFSTMAIMMMPRYIGHSLNNSKDLPFACTFAWAMVALTTLFKSKFSTWESFILCGIAFGITLSLRTGGFLLFGYLLVITAFYLFQSQKFANLKSILKSDNRQYIFKPVALFLVAWGIMIIAWPWAIEHPIKAPIDSFKFSSNFSSVQHVLFGGKTIASNQLPWDYLVRYFIITTPIPLLILFSIGVMACLISLYKDWRSHEAMICFIALFWSFFPLTYSIIIRPNIYDGLRHFLFIIPAISIIIGYGSASLLNITGNSSLKKFLAITVVLFQLYPLKDIVALHPYQSSYFNAIVGGVATAQHNYESDYWVSSYKEAAEWINQKHLTSDREKSTVLLAANKHSKICFDNYVDKGITVHTIFAKGIKTPLPDAIDYYVSTTRFDLDKNFPNSPIIKTIGRAGGIFTVIKGQQEK